LRFSVFLKTMILKPQLQDLKNIGYYSGKIIIGISLTMLVPMVIGLLFAEINPALDFLIAAEIALLISLILTKLCFTEKDLNWMQGMVVALGFLFGCLF
jgi:Trk-type K+ transport system membrane component